jgi:hypothetical protein
MHGSGRARGWLVHLMAGAALGAAVVLVVWIFSGGRPFGEVVGSGDVSSPTPAAVAKTAPAKPVDTSSRLASRPPALARGELRFRQPNAERKVAARKPKRAARRMRTRRGPVVRVVAPPPGQQTEETPIAAAPSPTSTPVPTAAPAPASPPRDGAGDRRAKPKTPGPTLWAGEG